MTHQGPNPSHLHFLTPSHFVIYHLTLSTVSLGGRGGLLRDQRGYRQEWGTELAYQRQLSPPEHFGLNGRHIWA